MDFRTTILLSVLVVVNLSWDCEAMFNPCKYGYPYANTNCGRGGQLCPADHYCEISPVDAYALCCPDYCGNGIQPLKNVYNQPEHCGRGGIICPSDYTCHVAPTDAWAVCCPN